MLEFYSGEVGSDGDSSSILRVFIKGSSSEWGRFPPGVLAILPIERIPR